MKASIREFIGFVVIISLAILFIAGLGLVGSMDKTAEEEEFEEYCRNVKDGTWPDYKEMVKECK